MKNILDLLPAPPVDKAGWPWTQPATPLPDHMEDGSPWPRITVVTPSYNQAEYVEETLRSVLLQGYPNLEYQVLDGGSTDRTVQILEKYDPWISHWVSQPDGGQSRAINQGLRAAKGEIFTYINSDDYLMPGALAAVAQAFHRSPDASVVYGRCRHLEPGREFLRQPRFDGLLGYIRIWDLLTSGEYMTQPEVFSRTDVLREIGGFREDLNWVFDYAMWLELLGQGHRFEPVNALLATYRIYPTQKSSVGGGEELYGVVREFLERHASPVPVEQRLELLEELEVAKTRWTAREALAEVKREGYPTAAARALAAAFRDPGNLASWGFWGITTAPLHPLLPYGLKRRLVRTARRFGRLIGKASGGPGREKPQ